MDGAGPGSYDFPKSYDTTQRHKVSMAKQTDNRVGFTDSYAKLYKYIPGMGHYKEVDRGLKVIGKETLSTAK